MGPEMATDVNHVKIAKNFYLDEFESPDTKQVIVRPKLIYKIQQLRDWIEKALRVNSGYRTPKHNKEIGGSRHSLHMIGAAADVYSIYCDVERIAHYAKILKFGGIIIHHIENFVHLDIRKKIYHVTKN